MKSSSVFWGIAFLLTAGRADGAFERLPLGARAASLCDASQLSVGDPFCWGTNPSLLAKAGSTKAAFTYTPGLFGLTDLQRDAAVLRFDALSGGAGTLFKCFGNDLYRELSIDAGYGGSLSENVQAGVSLSLYHLQIEGYGHANAVGLNAGVCMHIADQVAYGISVLNANSPKIGISQECVGAEFLATAMYAPTECCSLMLSVSKPAQSPMCFAAGIEYLLERVVSLRLGANEGLSQYGLGVGATLGFAEVDYGVAIHQELGITHHFEIAVELP